MKKLNLDFLRFLTVIILSRQPNNIVPEFLKHLKSNSRKSNCYPLDAEAVLAATTAAIIAVCWAMMILAIFVEIEVVIKSFFMFSA